MRLPPFDYIEPKSVGESCRALQGAGTEARIIAGGTDLVMALKYRLKMPKLLIGLNRIARLQQIRYSGSEGLTIGAMTSLRHLTQHRVIREHYPLLARAALCMGSVQLQAMGTIGGNLCQDACCIYYSRTPMMREAIGPCFKSGGSVCHVVKSSKNCWATYCGDLAPALLALGATVTIAGPDGENTIPLRDLFTGSGEQPNALFPGKILTEVHIPPLAQGRAGSAYLKMRVRKAIDYPLLGVAVNLVLDGDGGIWKNIAIGLTAVDKAPLLIQVAGGADGEKDLPAIRTELAEAAFRQATPIANTYGYSPKYRREMVKVYVNQAVQQAYTSALGKEGAA